MHTKKAFCIKICWIKDAIKRSLWSTLLQTKTVKYNAHVVPKITYSFKAENNRTTHELRLLREAVMLCERKFYQNSRYFFPLCMFTFNKRKTFGAWMSNFDKPTNKNFSYRNVVSITSTWLCICSVTKQRMTPRVHNQDL